MDNIKKHAELSPCGKYRYSLSRIWDLSKGLVLFIMLNPSTADVENDDPTIRRCISFAKYWGYGGIMVGNLSPFRATNPVELKTMINDPYVNDQNAQAIMGMWGKSSLMVFAWGNPPCQLPQCPVIGDHAYHLGLTKLGNPKHPLYLKKDLKPIMYERRRHFG